MTVKRIGVGHSYVTDDTFGRKTFMVQMCTGAKASKNMMSTTKPLAATCLQPLNVARESHKSSGKVEVLLSMIQIPSAQCDIRPQIHK
jgi:hypothetical protein